MRVVIAVLAAVAVTLVAAAKKTTTTTPMPQHTFSWKWNNLWMNPDNWEGDECPSFGDNIVFPEFFTKFGDAMCASPTDTDCSRGGVLSMQSIDAAPFTAQAGALSFPAYGTLTFDAEGTLSLGQSAVPRDVQWKDRGDASRDFRCAANWNVDGHENVDFIRPCFNDFADFTNPNPFLLEVTKNSFVFSVTDPSAHLLDPRQKMGTNIRMDINCPKPFGVDSGVEFCQALCHNTCEDLNPDRKEGLTRQLAYVKEDQSFLNEQLDVVDGQLSALVAPVEATGTVTFVTGIDTYEEAINAVATRLMTELDKYWDVDVTFTCGLSAGGVWGIDCNAVAHIPSVKVGAYTFVQSGERVFRDGLLNNIFDSIVAQMFIVEQNNVLLTMGQKQASTPFVSAQFDVPQRFINDLGVPLPISDITAALASRLGVQQTDITNIGSYASTKDGFAGFSFTVFTTGNSLTSSSIASNILAASRTVPIFTVTLSNGLSTPLYNPVDHETASVARLSVVEVTLQNQLLFNDLPFNDTQTSDFATKVGQFLASNSVGGASDIIRTTVFKDPSTLVATRRDTVPQVKLAFTVPSSSVILVNTGLASLFGGFVYGGASSTTVGSTTFLSVDDLAKQVNSAALAQYQANINAADAAITSLANSIANSGAPPNLAAHGDYAWDNINTIVNSLGNAALENSDCKTLMTQFTASGKLNSRFKEVMSTFLPVPADSITINSPLVCMPAVENRNRDYQPAVFHVDITVSAPYIYFADESYVSYSSSNVNHALQFNEANAPLNQAAVLDAVNRALYTMTLEAYDSHITQEQTDIQNDINQGTTRTTTTTLPTTTPGTADTAASSASAGSGAALFGAAAGGGIILIVIIVIIVVRKRRGTPNSARKPERSVVAFENPMYDNMNNASTAQPTYDNREADENNAGLYDEPAFRTETDKENPLYESTDNLAMEPTPRLDDGNLNVAAAEEEGGDNGYLDVAAEE